MPAIRNVVIAGRRTSVRLEQSMWDALREIAAERGMSIHELATEIDANREARGSMPVAIRIYIVGYLREGLRQRLPKRDKPDAAH